jgi:hypothetical protein
MNEWEEGDVKELEKKVEGVKWQRAFDPARLMKN